MSERALLFDVGNTRVKWAVADGSVAGRSVVRCPWPGSARKDSSVLAGRLPRNVSSVMVSNVAGADVASDLSQFVRREYDLDARFCRPERSAHGVTNGYRQPRRLGVDRWAAMIGARAETRAALCIVDAGSAVTIDALDRTGQHLGGQIIPGLRLMASALKRETNGMREMRIRTGSPGSGLSLFAGNTADAVRAGALNAVCGAVERATKILRSEGMRPRLFVTGGGAPALLEALDSKASHRPNLVLQGLATMLDETS